MSGPDAAAPPRRIAGLDALSALVGETLGVSGWLRVDAERVRAFAAATGDRQWIHLDEARAAAESPWGGTVAHGLLTLSLIPALRAAAFEVEAVRTRVNYGFDRVRFPAALRVGGRVRGMFRLRAVDPREGGALVRTEATVEIEGGRRPTCVAETLALYLR